MKKTVFIKNAAVLTVTGLILRFAGIIFKVYLSRLIGSEGVGLYQLVFSLYVLAATFATSGISTAVTRLCADTLASSGPEKTKKVLKKSIILSLAIAFVTVFLLITFADFTAEKILGDSRAAISIRILSFSLPFMGVCSCIRGYFLARRKAGANASSQLFEQAVRIITVILLIRLLKGKSLALTCGAVLFGDTVAEISGTVLIYLLYKADIKKVPVINSEKGSISYKSILHISVPITLGRYLNSALRTGENILVPKCLSKSGKGNALSLFGSIKGMALPVIFFPSTLLSSISLLLIPEISRAVTLGRKAVVKQTAEKIITLTAVCSYIFASLFFIAGRSIGNTVYGDTATGEIIRLLSPIVPLMYLDSICDGILKGLDKQSFSFKVSVSDSVIRLILIVILLPKYGIHGFITVMYISNALTCLLNLNMLVKTSNAEIKVSKTVFLPVITALCVTYLSNTAVSLLNLTQVLSVILLCAVSVTAYALLIIAFGVISIDDIKDIIH